LFLQQLEESDIMSDEIKDCEVCGGSGEYCNICHGECIDVDHEEDEKEDCPECGGSGEIEDES